MSDVAVVFGASGFLGRAVRESLELGGVGVVGATRGPGPDPTWLSTSEPGWADGLEPGSVTRVVWAQGVNAAGSILDDGPGQLAPLFEANVGYVVTSLRAMLDSGCLAPRARMVILSSVWQRTARPGKLAYVTSKAALEGLIGSLVADLGPMGLSINAVLPGVIDGPMTRAFLSEMSIATLERDTPGGHLVTAAQVASVCSWLTSPASAGVNGQSLIVDGGWERVRHV